ncbi:MarP family serine protease [Microbacterium sp. X-17]|uniref:MarP family serine protease n=1 Tax=Microbacterium sp. X-17 TaxID=3144404 RepID=UPI0031F498DE
MDAAGIVVEVIVVLVLILAGIAGVRRGLVASLGALVGFAVGAVAAYALVPLLAALWPWPAWRGVVTVAGAVLVIALLTAAGGVLGAFLRRGVDRVRLRPVDRVLGGVLSVVVAALAVSLVGQSVSLLGIPVVSTAVSQSTVLRVIEDITPRPIATALAQVRGALIDDGIPKLDALLAPPNTYAAPNVSLDDPALNAAAQSVARVSGVAFACGKGSSGSGFAVTPDRIVTNAHVVAGVETPLVELPGEAGREGRVVYFDPTGDLAVIAVDGLDATPLPVVPTPAPGSDAVVQGYPWGGPFTTGAARVLSVGPANVPDIYDRPAPPREIATLAAVVRPGNSGGPLLTPDGRVAGVVFARSDTDDNIGFALTAADLAPALAASASSTPVSTGPCTP